MPPKFRYSKDEIVKAGLDILRKDGLPAVTARRVGAELSSSSKIIFSVFKDMDEYKNEVINAGLKFYENYITDAMKNAPSLPYKASGLAYIRFAGEEKELFRLLFMERPDTVKDDKSVDEVIKNLCAATGYSKEKAMRFHLALWVCVHGIAVMKATDFYNISHEQTEKILTDVFNGMKKSFSEENDGSDSNR